MKREFLVVSTSLNPESKSRILAQEVYQHLRGLADVEFIDLREYSLPICDGDESYSHPSVATLTEKIKHATAVLLAVPVYNYSSAASAKNLIELTGSAWNEKIVGFLCAAGGKSSYMSVLGLANSLMLDFRCLINPRFVYADSSAFDADGVADPDVKARVKELAASTIKIVGRSESKVQV